MTTIRKELLLLLVLIWSMILLVAPPACSESYLYVGEESGGLIAGAYVQVKWDVVNAFSIDVRSLRLKTNLVEDTGFTPRGIRYTTLLTLGDIRWEHMCEHPVGLAQPATGFDRLYTIVHF